MNSPDDNATTILLHDGNSGKRRPKMDIEFECQRRGVRPEFGFETKRLGNGKTVGDYLGPEGLSAFVTEYDPTTHGEVGMIGYDQDASVDSWSEKLTTELTRQGKSHSVVEPWAQHRGGEGELFYSSTHGS